MCRQNKSESRPQKQMFIRAGVSIGIVIGFCIILIGILHIYQFNNNVSIYCEDQHIAGPLISNLSMSTYQNLQLKSLKSTYQVILRKSLPNRIHVPLVHIKQGQGGVVGEGSAEIVRYLSFDYSSEYTSPVMTMGVAAACMTFLLEHNSRLHRNQNKQLEAMSPPTR